MKSQIRSLALDQVKTEVLVLPVFEKESQDQGISEVKAFLKTNPDFGKTGENQLVFSGNQQILLLGAGKADKFNFEKLQNFVGSAVKCLLKLAKSASIALPQVDSVSPEKQAEAAAIGLEIASHDPAADYKSDYKAPKLTSVEVIAPSDSPKIQAGFKRGLIIAEAILMIKKLGDMPANEMTPTYFLNATKKIAADNKLKLTVLTEPQAQKKGMGAFIGVAQGSEEPSFMIALEYTGNSKSKEKWGLIGKGITFDTGGISIKPSNSMHEMKYDMLGAATVMTTIAAISQLNMPINVVSVMAVTENFPGGRAQRPGDIVKTYSGKTAEVLNTDAEGRLVLVDALTFAQRDFKATKLIDLATLTGAMIVALGDFITGAFGNNSKFTQQLMDAGAKVGEKYWEFPMDEAFDEMIESDMADITNIGHGGSHPSAAGSITGAKFIEAVVEDDRPWIHLDIAGTGWDNKSKSYRASGATGVGVKTLVELLSERTK